MELTIAVYAKLMEYHQNITQLKIQVSYCIMSIYFNSLIFKHLILFSRPPLAFNFVDVGVTVNLPDSLLDVLLVVRAMLVKYDHFSDLCPSWVPNPLPEEEQKGTVPIHPLKNQEMKTVYCYTPFGRECGKLHEAFRSLYSSLHIVCD